MKEWPLNPQDPKSKLGMMLTFDDGSSAVFFSVADGTIRE
tara:strand:- start:35475 stop:35594 length:120 start_codon:yes stop_codon:yes gene_type:complete